MERLILVVFISSVEFSDIFTLGGEVNHTIYTIERQEVKFSCESRSNDDVLWERMQFGTETTQQINMHSGIFHIYTDRFRMSEKYNLILNEASLDDAGKYVCLGNHGMGGQKIVTYNLVVISSLVSCNTNTKNIIGMNSCNIPQSEVAYYCQVIYKGAIVPDLVWIDPSTGSSDSLSMEIHSHRDNITDAIVLSNRLLVKAGIESPTFLCSLNNLLNCTTKPIFIPYVLKSNSYLSRYVNKSGTIECLANSSVTCSYKWNLGKKIITYDQTPDVYVLVHSMDDQQKVNFTCTANCHLGDRTCEVHVMTIELFNSDITNANTIEASLIFLISLCCVAIVVFFVFLVVPIRKNLYRCWPCKKGILIEEEALPINPVCFISGHSIDPLENVSLPCYILKLAENFGPRPALIDSVTNKTITYSELKDLVERVASGLWHDFGLRQEMRVGLVAPNCIQYPILYYSILRTGAICVPITSLSTQDDLVTYVADSNIEMVITVAELVDKFRYVRQHTSTISKIILIEKDNESNLPSLEGYFNDQRDGLQNGQALAVNRVVPEIIKPLETIATISYSSGTTGFPKGCVHTHGSFQSNLKQMLHHDVEIYKKGEDVTIAIVSMSHMYGQDVYLLAAIASGCTMIVLRTFYVSSYLDLIKNHKVTCAHLVPTYLLQLLQSNLLNSHDLKTLLKVETKAAHLTATIVNLFKEKLPHCQLLKGYGMTEAMCLTKERHSDVMSNESVGKLLPDVTALVIDVKTRMLLGRDQSGELCFRSPALLKEYWRKPFDKEIDKEGYLHTGDVGYFDDYSRLYIVDRLKDFIKCGEELVSPVELENIILRHPKVADVGVVGVHVPQLGESPRAFVVKKTEDLLDIEIINYVSKLVPPYKQLCGGVIFTDAIPRLPSGKIIRQKLRQMAVEVSV